MNFSELQYPFGGDRLGRTLRQELILIFRGTHQVLSAEKHLKKAGVPMRLIPVPRRLTSDCGLAIRIYPPDREMARNILSRHRILPKSVHILRGKEEYEEEPL
jgi:Putative Se/S carrier protein-like